MSEEQNITLRLKSPLTWMEPTLQGQNLLKVLQKELGRVAQ